MIQGCLALITTTNSTTTIAFVPTSTTNNASSTTSSISVPPVPILKPLRCYQHTDQWSGKPTGQKTNCSVDTAFCYVLIGHTPSLKQTRGCANKYITRICKEHQESPGQSVCVNLRSEESRGKLCCCRDHNYCNGLVGRVNARWWFFLISWIILVHDKAVDRTLARIRAHSEDGRLVVLVCKTKCLKERSEISKWIRQFNTEHNVSGESLLGFHFHFYKLPMAAYEIDEKIRKKPSVLLYVVAGRPFYYERQGDVLKDKAEFIEWLLELEKPSLAQVKDYLELDNYLGIEGHNCSEDKEWHKYVILVHHLTQCRDFLINNIARSFHGDPNVTTIELVRPLTPETEAVLNWRLVGLSKKCRMIVVIHNSAFLEVDNDISPAQLYHFTQSWTNQGNCSHPVPNVVRAPLNDIQIQYFSDEISIKEIEYNRVYILVGTIGGIAVVALAISIFWV
uniref:Uncharacterized protein n=1 Tax=Ditylenchus dipsaci TaxID=166011 RepID=A0A915DTX2_9BILA